LIIGVIPSKAVSEAVALLFVGQLSSLFIWFSQEKHYICG
jgi:hypothetical protein